MHHGKVHPGKVTTELISDSLYCVCDWLLNSIKGKTTTKAAASNNTQVYSANHQLQHLTDTHTHKVLGGVCVCLHVSVCACLDTIKTSSWRRVPMHHPDDSGQAACFAAADIELNDVVLHCGCRGWPAHHWCVAAGFQLGGGVCVCVFRQTEPLVGCRGVKMPVGIFETEHGVFDKQSCRRRWCRTPQPVQILSRRGVKRSLQELLWYNQVTNLTVTDKYCDFRNVIRFFTSQSTVLSCDKSALKPGPYVFSMFWCVSGLLKSLGFQ